MENEFLQLNERHKIVLLAIIEGYFETASPVGSRYVCENYNLKLSPASIRSIMAELEESGYIYQPHLSAGRVPTASGYKFYIESLIILEKISRQQKEKIRSGINLENRSIKSIMGQVSRALSNISRYTGVVLAPDTLSASLLHIEFLRIRRRDILAVLVFKNGAVENRLIHFEKDITQYELGTFSRKLNNVLEKADCGIEGLKKIINREIDGDRKIFYKILDDIVRNMDSDCKNIENCLYVGPEIFLIDEPEFSQNERIKLLLKAINDKKTIIKLLGLAKDSTTKQVFIGSEAEWSEINGLSLITAPYIGKNCLLKGSIGIIGPSRMNYSQVIPIIEFMAGFLGDII